MLVDSVEVVLLKLLTSSDDDCIGATSADWGQHLILHVASIRVVLNAIGIYSRQLDLGVSVFIVAALRLLASVYILDVARVLQVGAGLRDLMTSCTSVS